MNKIDCEFLKFKWNMFVHDDKDSVVSRRLSRNKCWEFSETELIFNVLNSGDYAIDLGANIGWYTSIMAQVVGVNGKVLAVEPSVENIEVLRENIIFNKWEQVEIFEGAVGEHADKIKLLKNIEGNYGDFRTWNPNSDTHSLLSEDINVLPLDFLVSSWDKKKIKAIKMDCQGSEPKILKGMKDTINNLPIGAGILMEVWPGAWKKQSIDPLDALSPIRNKFNVYQLEKGTNQLISFTWKEFDDMCVRRYHHIKMSHKAWDIWFVKI